jgi:hypothetical protein
VLQLPKLHDFSAFIEEDGDEPPVNPPEHPVDESGQAVYEQPLTDVFIHAEELLPQGEEVLSAKVIGRSKNKDVNIFGEYNADSLLNTMVYDVQFPYGTVKGYSAPNVIAQNLWQHSDIKGQSHSIEVCYHSFWSKAP